MEIMEQLFANKALWCAVSAWVICQVIKGVTYSIRNRHLNLRNFFGSGGMPSSHSSSVAAMTTMIGVQNGLASTLFALSFLFSCIVMYDAAGVRQETGKQGSVINLLLGITSADHPDMKEKVGHTPLEVLAGAAVGILLALAAHLMFH